MTDSTTPNLPGTPFSDPATQTRWNWVHQAIRFAKERNRTELMDAEADAATDPSLNPAAER
ncbi:MAG: hypothetical protein AAFX58_01500 [Pseudomonadota bacterium]